MTAVDLDAALARVQDLEHLQPVPATEVSYDAGETWGNVESALMDAWDAFWQSVSAFATVTAGDVHTRVGYSGHTVAFCTPALTAEGARAHLVALARQMEIQAKLLAVALTSARTAASLTAAAQAPTAWTVVSAVRNGLRLADELRALSAARQA